MNRTGVREVHSGPGKALSTAADYALRSRVPIGSGLCDPLPMAEGAITTSVLMCHAPIVVPGIASESRAEASTASTRAMSDAAAHVCRSEPDAVVIVSPHAPRHERAFLVASDARAAGDFGRFGIAEVGADVPGHPKHAHAITQAARQLGGEVETRNLGRLDHGTLVPLWFLADAGWRGPTMWIALPMRPDHAACEGLGAAIAAAAEAVGQKWAFVASGDMSHRLTPDAPAGYAEEAAAFDQAICDAVGAGDVARIRAIDPELRALAAEDVVDSLDVALGVTGGRNAGHQVLSYQGPYGVGYLVAIIEA
jgi:aromatic ring-opening dioxygenase LigB subunit